MCVRIFMPTPRRLLLFLIFLVFTLSGILVIVPPFQNLFGFPYLVLSGYSAAAAQAIYSYILACIYAFAYVRLEANIRTRYPHMNDIVKGRRLKTEGGTEERRRPQTPSSKDSTFKQEAPSGKNPVAAPEHPAASKLHPYRRARSRIKKAAVKRRKKR